MNNKYRIIFASAVISIILVATVLCSQDQIVRFAVSPFETLTADAESEKAGSLASKEIEESLSKGKWFELRKSSELEDFIQKLSLAQAGKGDEGAVVREGKNLKIDYLNVGSVAKLGLTYEVDSRSVDINNWMIVHSAGCSAVDLDSACDYIN